MEKSSSKKKRLGKMGKRKKYIIGITALFTLFMTLFAMIGGRQEAGNGAPPGLTAVQVKQLEEKGYTQDERVEIALLCLNREETLEDVLEKLEKGKSISELKEETKDEK
ncbi:MAG: hypothetical protein J1F02_12385 [Lachnospiraceae bacterium]|nr:hypothetical protein [Lachnospiraceae bacterium]